MSNPLSPNMDSNFEFEVAKFSQLEMNSDSQIPPPMFNAHWDCSFSMSNHSLYTSSSTNSSVRNPDRRFALIDPDPYEFQIVSNSIRSIHEKGYEQGYVMKNDPFKKEMLLSSKEVLIEKGKLLDEQIKCRDCGKIIQSSGKTKTIDICKRRILPGTSSIKDMPLIQKILLAYSLKAIEN